MSCKALWARGLLLPPPLRGRAGVGGSREADGNPTPHPNPPPQGGREPETPPSHEVMTLSTVLGRGPSLPFGTRSRSATQRSQGAERVGGLANRFIASFRRAPQPGSSRTWKTGAS